MFDHNSLLMGLLHMISLLRSQNCGRDEQGREVLVGLTYEESIEFAILDAFPPAADSVPWEAEVSEFPPSEGRWLELYFKHQAARRLAEER
jgi:hypothetical protein